MASGDEHIAPGYDQAEQIIDVLRKHVQDGGTVLVLGGGGYPAYHPGKSELANKFGFELEFVRIPADG